MGPPIAPTHHHSFPPYLQLVVAPPLLYPGSLSVEISSPNCGCFDGSGQERIAMRYTHSGRILLGITLAISSPAWGQGGTGRAGRAAAQQAPTPANAPGSVAGRGGRGGDATGGD